MLLRLGQSLAFHAHRHARLILGQMFSSVLAATRFMYLISRRENLRQVTKITGTAKPHSSSHDSSGGKDNFYVILLQAVLQFPGPVNDLVGGYDKQVFHVSCRNGVYCINFQYLLSRYGHFIFILLIVVVHTTGHYN